MKIDGVFLLANTQTDLDLEDGRLDIPGLICTECGATLVGCRLELRTRIFKPNSERAKLLPWTVKDVVEKEYTINPDHCPKCNKKFEGIAIDFRKEKKDENNQTVL